MRVHDSGGLFQSNVAGNSAAQSALRGCPSQGGFLKTRVDLQCSPYQEVTCKIYHLKQLFLPPATTGRFTKIK